MATSASDEQPPETATTTNPWSSSSESNLARRLESSSNGCDVLKSNRASSCKSLGRQKELNGGSVAQTKSKAETELKPSRSTSEVEERRCQQTSFMQHEQPTSRPKVSRRSGGSNANNTRKPPSNVNKQQQRQANINYWNYKQTGIKSRPIKLLKHPIEHIERKIIITYLLSFLFKLIAILTGPLLVLLAYLITVPLLLSRKFIWLLLNSKFTCNAKIKTDDCSSYYLREDVSSDDELAAEDWRYCPLTYIESYWFKERLVNTVLLVLDNRAAPFSIRNFRLLVRKNILANRAFRKFSCNVLALGLPLFKSFYWHHLQFSLEDSSELAEVNNSNNKKASSSSSSSPSSSSAERWPTSNVTTTTSERSSLQTVVDQFSVTSIAPSTCPPSSNGSNQSSAAHREPSNNCSGSLKRARQIDIEQNNWRPTTAAKTTTTTTTDTTNSSSLSEHIFLDQNLADEDEEKVHLSSVRRYVHRLIHVGLDLRRPLWEVRVIPSKSERKTYLVFRCHQSLADGKSLSRILTDCLSDQPEQLAAQVKPVVEANPSQAPSGDDDHEQVPEEEEEEEEEEDEEDETELKPLREKRSFVAKMSKSSSWRSAIFVGPLTVMLWVIWTFTRRKHNHLNKCLLAEQVSSPIAVQNDNDHARRFYMAHYCLTKFHQIKQMTRSTVNDVILCALSGALRDYLRKYNGVRNPPNLNISLIVDMRQPEVVAGSKANDSTTITSAGNQVNCALVNVPLPTSVYGTVPSLWDVRNTMDELRTSADPWVMLGLQRFLFHLLPVAWYQRLVNYISLRNSSIFVSNLHGPETRVEAWCVDLLQRAVYESQQPACAIQPQSITSDQQHWWPDRAVCAATGECEPEEAMRSRRRRRRDKQTGATRLKLLGQLGSISAIYYCMQPPTSDIPISFNCISYHNKLFITALSRSLLVEDSKILLKLVFKHLDQLANTIAKRRSLVTIIRTPVPIEISCQPASPVATSCEFLNQIETNKTIETDDGENDNNNNNDDDDVSSENAAEQTDEEQRGNFRYERQTISPASSGVVLFGSAPKDDITIIGGRKNACSTCEQLVCTCRRRKSLFNFDYNKQRAVNLLSLLHPANFIAMRTSKSQETSQFDDNEGLQQGNNSLAECACGKQLLEELDEDGGTSSRLAFNSNLHDQNLSGREVLKSLSSEDNSMGGAYKQQAGGSRVTCAECRLFAAQSSLSLDLPIDQKRRYELRAKKSSNSDQNIKSSNLSIDSKRANLLRPFRKGRLESKQHSRSETDLLPTGNNRRGGKLSPKVVMQQRSMVVVKDEINADVTLRYQIDGQSFLGIRNRRFSTIGSAVAGTQRRASLIPFGLIQNSSISKLFKDDGEVHV